MIAGDLIRNDCANYYKLTPYSPDLASTDIFVFKHKENSGSIPSSTRNWGTRK